MPCKLQQLIQLTACGAYKKENGNSKMKRI